MSPWSSIPASPPFVLKCDRPFVDHFNQVRAKDNTRIHTDLLPEPYFGNQNAQVVILLLNPRVGKSDANLHGTPEFARSLRAALGSSSEQIHFYLSCESRGTGSMWWERTCKALLTEVTKDELSRRLLTVEYSPYHSKGFGHGDYRLPSQEFGFNLVRRAIDRNALIVCMRGERFWLGAIPQLATHKRVLKLRNPRSASLSPGNLDDFKKLLAALRVAT